MVDKIKTLPIRETEIELFVNRKEEVNYIYELLKTSKNCAISGTKGIGKTSLLNVIKNELKKNYKTILISVPSLDKTYFYRKLLNRIINKNYDYNFEESKRKLSFSQQIETLAKLLLKGENIGEIQEKKVFNFISSLIDDNKKFKDNLLSTEKIHSILKNFFESLEERIIIIVDDLDKIEIDEEAKNNKIYNFLIEISELINQKNITWLFSINKNLHNKIEKDLIENESNSIFSFLNDVINLEPFSVNQLRSLLFKRLSSKELGNYTDAAMRIIFAISKGNPRLLMHMIIKTLKYKKLKNSGKIDASVVMETIKRLFSIDEKSNTIIQYVSRKSFVFSGDKTLQHETNLDSVSLTMRLKELANKKLVTSEIVNQKKAYWLSYIHDESVLDGGEK